DHEDAIVKDEIRQAELTKLGLSFLRFDDIDVKNK
ncbi:MAG: very-short-patch-repair endonuclease, partial [Cyclobacteriaceae bacterium]